MKRGTLAWVNLEPAKPPEVGKVRPAVVVSNSEQNAVLGSVVVLPLSSRGSEIWPLRIGLSASGLKRSFAILPGIRQVSKDRLGTVLGLVETLDLDRLDEALLAYLSD